MVRSVTLAITGASGLQYGMRLLQCLMKAQVKINLLFSQAAHAVAIYELDKPLPRQTSKLRHYLLALNDTEPEYLQVFDQLEWTAPIASGSNTADAMVICPCSSGTLAAIAQGMSNNLIERAADVMLKENKKLIVVPRETPLSLTHVENMRKLLEMRVIVMPASPGFYHQPRDINDLIDFMVARLLDQLHVEHNLVKRWGADL